MKKLFLCIVVFLAGCTLAPPPKAPPAAFDLGLASASGSKAPRIRASLTFGHIVAPVWLDTPAMIYRLNYQNPARHLSYSQSRWAAAPASLLTQRLRGRLAAASDGGVLSEGDGARTELLLRVDLEEFTHVFDTVEASRAVVVARATLIQSAQRTSLGQRLFNVERGVAQGNAESGAQALAGASDEMIDAIVAWVAATAGQVRK